MSERILTIFVRRKFVYCVESKILPIFVGERERDGESDDGKQFFLFFFFHKRNYDQFAKLFMSI